MLRATRRGTDRTEAQGSDTYWITHPAVRDFVLRYPDEIDLARVEKIWFVDLVTAGRIASVRNCALLRANMQGSSEMTCARGTLETSGPGSQVKKFEGRGLSNPAEKVQGSEDLDRGA